MKPEITDNYPNLVFEYPVVHPEYKLGQIIQIVDASKNHRIWEFKTVDNEFIQHSKQFPLKPDSVRLIPDSLKEFSDEYNLHKSLEHMRNGFIISDGLPKYSERPDFRKQAEDLWWVIFNIQCYLENKFNNQEDIASPNVRSMFDFINSNCNKKDFVFKKDKYSPILQTPEEIKRSSMSVLETFKRMESDK